MGFKVLVMVLILSFISMSCSTINFNKNVEYSDRDYRKLNSLGAEYSSIIYLLNGKTIRSKLVKAKVDSLHFEKNGSFISIHQSEVEKVEILSFGDRIGNGFFWGSMGLLVGVASISTFLFLGSEGGALIAIIPTIGLSITGLIWGYSTGNQEFVFNKR